MEIAGRVFRDEDDDSQSNGLENGSIFIGRKACVIDAVIADTRVDFAPIRPDRKQQHAGFPQVLHQMRKVRPLLVLRQMKEAVPPDETAEALRQIARPHVAEPPVTGRRFKSRNGQHRRISVDAGNPKAASGDIGGDGIARPQPRSSTRPSGVCAYRKRSIQPRSWSDFGRSASKRAAFRS